MKIRAFGDDDEVVRAGELPHFGVTRSVPSQIVEVRAAVHVGEQPGQSRRERVSPPRSSRTQDSSARRFSRSRARGRPRFDRHRGSLRAARHVGPGIVTREVMRSQRMQGFPPRLSGRTDSLGDDLSKHLRRTPSRWTAANESRSSKRPRYHGMGMPNRGFTGARSPARPCVASARPWSNGRRP